ncbi:MAG: class I mannose-6-phosphate isomerase [Bacteroidales bacterium]|nr:class I mannose-6-phosphate isomerase [Bacteroidales bacterium]MBN2697304.1 class I mannose-6-phosphate isomerase [Bacteroidales bacterium]
MEHKLYPLKFKPIYKQVIWGGERLREAYGKTNAPEKTGESWEISGVEGNLSVVSDGFLKGNNLEELIEVYMGDLIGDSVYEQHGLRFPVLVKLIHSSADLSIQVHPDNEYARREHGGSGKTEMWYIMEAGKGARLITGFSRDIDRRLFMEKLNARSLEEILNFEQVKSGDVLFIPPGRIHAIGPGIVLAEIQQTSDITYRIYDWDRTGPDGKPRELHLEHALNVLDYKAYPSYKTEYSMVRNSSVNLVDCPWFTSQVMDFDQPVDKDFNFIDSFVIYVCTEGQVELWYPGGDPVSVRMGESLLVPAVLKELTLVPRGRSILLEVYMKLNSPDNLPG